MPPACAGAGAGRSSGAARPSASSRWRPSPCVLDAVVSNRNERERKAGEGHRRPSASGSATCRPPPRRRHAAARPPAGASDLDRLDAREPPSCAPPRPRSPATRRPAIAAASSQGPISRTECGPLLRAKDAVPDDRVLSKSIGRYDCVAVKTSVTGEGGQSVGRLGFPFVAALDFKKFTYVWCRNTPGQGERGVALAFVRLDRACLAAKGRALGTGYVDVPGS